ncbi:MAG: hypothetical protein ABL921_12935, partial [Pirellula sp.]
MRVSTASSSASEMRTYVAAYLRDAGIRYQPKPAALIPFQRDYRFGMQIHPGDEGFNGKLVRLGDADLRARCLDG